VKILVVGKGAVGTYLGELLRGIGNDVVYAPRDLAAVETTAADVAIVAVKAFATEAAIATLRRALPEKGGTAIVTPQNGVGNEELLAAAFGADAILACALTVPVEIGPDGMGRAASGGGIAFAPVGTTTAHNWVLAMFGETALPVSAHDDYRALKWSKLALNIVANASCAILNQLPEQVVANPLLFDLELRALREARDVMAALKLRAVDLPRYPVRSLFAASRLPTPLARAILGPRIAKARGAKPPSLLLDLRNAKHETEVGALNGAIAAAGARVGLPTPVNAALARILTDIALMPQRWATYRERPEALDAEVRSAVPR
jgi:2-dehydropantoate 2-reductase